MSVSSFLVRWFIDLFSGQKDSSGITLYYTDKLRNYDLGIVAVGSQVNPWFVIPPKQKSWITEGYCMHQCTEVSSERSFKALNMILPSLLQWNSSMKKYFSNIFLSSNRPFDPYGGHIELIHFKECFRMPRGHEHISFAFSSAFRDIFS